MNPVSQPSELKISDGKIVITDAAVVITDKSKFITRVLFFAGIGGLFYAITSLFRFFRTAEPFFLWSGILLLVIWSIGLGFALVKNTSPRISIENIRRVVIKKNILGTWQAVFYITGARERIVILGSDGTIRQKLESLLQAHNIATNRGNMETYISG